MFFLLPVGHDKLIRRLPYLTIAFIAINVLCFIVTFPIQNRQQKRVEKMYREEVYPLESQFFEQYIQEHADEIQHPDFYRKFREAIKSGDLIDTTTAAFKRWQDASQHFEGLKESRVLYRFGFKPARFEFLNLFSSMFLHAGIMHLLFNMLFLWLVGVNIEDYWGRPLFAALFIIGGIFATLFFTIFNRGSTVPLVGASGAISALMGAFAVRFYRTKIRIFWFLLIFLRPFWGTFHVYAWIALGFWFVEQLFYSMLFSGAVTDVAFSAHVGGFIFGLVAGFAMKYLKVEEKFLSGKIEKQIEAVDLHPKMEEAFLKRDAGDNEGAILLLRTVLAEDPNNDDARLELTRCLVSTGRERQAAAEYEKMIALLYDHGKRDEIFTAFLEVYEHQLERFFSAKMQFKIASYLSAMKEYDKAVELFGMIAKHHPEDRLAPIGLLKAAKIFFEKLGKSALAIGALEFLIQQYPEHHASFEASSLLHGYENSSPD